MAQHGDLVDPKRSMGLVYLATFTINITWMYRYIYIPNMDPMGMNFGVSTCHSVGWSFRVGFWKIRLFWKKTDEEMGREMIVLSANNYSANRFRISTIFFKYIHRWKKQKILSIASNAYIVFQNLSVTMCIYICIYIYRLIIYIYTYTPSVWVCQISAPPKRVVYFLGVFFRGPNLRLDSPLFDSLSVAAAEKICCRDSCRRNPAKSCKSINMHYKHTPARLGHAKLDANQLSNPQPSCHESAS